MTEIVIITIFAIYILFSFIISAIDMAGASFYDVWMLKKIRDRKKRTIQKKTASPLVSVIIPAFNEEHVIERCLASFQHSTYKKFEIVVSDDGSTDATTKIVKQFAKSHKKMKIRIVADGKNRGRGGALNQGFKKSKGSLVMAIDADCTIEADTIVNAVAHFEDKSIAALAANVKIMPHLSILGLLQQFEWLAAWRSKKFNSYANAEYIIGGAGATYRRSIFKKFGGFNETMLTEDIDLSMRIASGGNREHILRYASDVVVMTEHVPTYKALFRQRFRWKLGMLQALFASRHLVFSGRTDIYTRSLTWFRLPVVIWSEIMLILEPLILSFFIYLAVVHQTPIMFIVSWVALMVSLFFVIWGDDILSARQKIRFTMFMPIMYFLYYILSFIQIIAMYKALRNHRRIRGIEKVRGNWVSPERIAS